MVTTKVDVRPATAEDLASVNDIYNQYVVEAHYTFDFTPMTIEARRDWFTTTTALGATG